MSAAVESGRPLLELSNVYKIYGKGDAEVRALDGMSVSIRAGELVALMGASGSGKSTAMNILGCLDTPTRGRYSFRGVDVGTLDRDQLALLRRHYIGFVFQSFNLLARTTALENVELPLLYRGEKRKLRVEKSLHVLDLVGLADRGGHTPAELSGGQQQRVAIARALVTEPSIVLADEPTGNLDSKRSAEILELLARLNEERGITIVVITHEPDHAAYLRRVIWMRDGKIERDGPPSEILA